MDTMARIASLARISEIMENYVLAEANVKAVELAKGTANVNVTKGLPGKPVINVLKDISKMMIIMKTI